MSDDDPASNNSSNQRRSLKYEWKLFWQSVSQEGKSDLAPEVLAQKDEKRFAYIQNLSIHELRTLSRLLSHERKLAYLKMERLHKEMELLRLKIETLNLVGSATQASTDRYNELLNQGEMISGKLEDLDSQLKFAKKAEERLLAEREEEL